MDKIARFAILSLFPFKRYGNGNCCKSCFDSRVTRRVFSFFGFYFRASLWLYCLLSSSSLIAELSPSDLKDLEGFTYDILRENLEINTRLESIENDTEAINSHSGNIRNHLQEIRAVLGYGSNGLGVPYGPTLNEQMIEMLGDLGDINDNITGLYDGLTSLESIYARLGEILDALDDNETGSGSGGDTSLPSDIATETTLSAFKGKYEEISDKILNSFGFSDTSDNVPSSFYDMFLNKYYGGRSYRYFKFNNLESVGAAKVPFPGSPYTWLNEYSDYVNDIESSRYRYTFPELINYPIVLQIAELERGLILLGKKQAWNDWQSHTNLISTLNTLSTPPKNYIDSSSDIGSVDSSTGEMTLTYNDSEGGSPPTPEVIDTKVVYTNDFSVLQTDSNSIGENLNKITYSKLNEKYKIPEGIEQNNYQDYSSKEALPDYTLQYGPKQYQSFRFTAKHRTMYNSIFSPQLCDKLRGVFSKLWFFLSIWFNFVLFKIFGKVKE